MFKPLLLCWDTRGEHNEAAFRALLFRMYDEVQTPGKTLGDLVIEQMLPRYADTDEATILVPEVNSKTVSLSEQTQLFTGLSVTE